MTVRPSRESRATLPGHATPAIPHPSPFAASAPAAPPALGDAPESPTHSGRGAHRGDPAVTAEVGSEPSTGYAAEHAPLAFGIPRIAPVPIAAAGSAGRPPGQNLVPAPRRRTEYGNQETIASSAPSSASPPRGEAFGEAFPIEDLTESLTAEEPVAAIADLSVPATVTLPGGAAREAGTVGDAAGSGAAAVNDQVTTMLRVPKAAQKPGPADWEEAATLSLAECAAAPKTLALPAPRLCAPLGGPLQTAAIPVLPLGTESATTTLTLPVATEPALCARPRRESGRRWLLFTGVAGAVLLAGAFVAALRALPLESARRAGGELGAGSGRSVAAPHAGSAPDASSERLIEQAMRALRTGHNDDAAALLLHYQAARPPGEPDPAVAIMLRVLRKEVAAPSPGR